MLNKNWSINYRGWLTEARHCSSPFFNQRPQGEPVSLLVVHGISLPPGQFGGPHIDELFTGKLDPQAHPYFAEIAHLEVSAHCLIRRDGEVVQYVSFLDRAWHSGRSQFDGRDNCNDFSIGIELEGTDDSDYSEAQYQQLAAVTKVIQQTYPAVTAERITGHSDIAPGRKTDPGSAFDWALYRNLMK